MLAGSPGSVSCGIPVPSIWALVCMRFCLCRLWLKSCFPQSYGSLKFHWPSRSDSLESPSSFVRSPGLEAWHGIQNLHNSGRTSLLLLFSSLWVTHPMGMRFDFIVIVPLLLSCCVFFVFGCGVSFFFFGMFQHPPLNSCSAVSCIFGALAGGDECMSFYSAILNCLFLLFKN